MAWKHVGDHYRTTRTPVFQWHDPPKGGDEANGCFVVIFWVFVGLCVLGMCTR